MYLAKLFARATRYLISKNRSLSPSEKEQVQGMLTKIERVLAEAEYVPVLTFEAAIKYFNMNAPKDQTVKKSVLLRERNRKGWRIIQVFMDEKDEIIVSPDKKNIPYGRQVPVGSLDKELEEAFGDVDLIIIE